MIYTVTLSPALDKTIHLNTFEKNELNIVSSSLLDPGGKGINSAKVLNSLESEVTSIAFLGGSVGDIIETMLNNANINQKNIYLDGETRTNIKIIESKSKTCTELNEKATNISDEELRSFDLFFENELDDAEYITFAGRLPENIDSDFYYRYILRAKAKGIKTLLDTSGEALKKGVLAKPWCIKPNIDELSEYFGEKLDSIPDIVLKCKELNNIGVEIVITTLGGEGVVCTTLDKTILFKAPKVEVKSTVGAGDSFVGGLLHKISLGETLENSIKFATATATAKVTLMGTSVPKKEDIEKYLREIV